MEADNSHLLKSALDALWTKFKPETESRVATLETAAASLAAGTLQPEQAEAAHSAAHKLSGALGSFGLTRGTELARELEAAYAPNAAPEPAAPPRLAGITAELKAIVRDRK